MVERKTYSRLFGLRYLPAASISNVKKRYTECIKILVLLSFLPFYFHLGSTPMNCVVISDVQHHTQNINMYANSYMSHVIRKPAF